MNIGIRGIEIGEAWLLSKHEFNLTKWVRVDGIRVESSKERIGFVGTSIWFR